MSDPVFGFGGFGFDPFGVPFISLDPVEDRTIVVGIGIEAHDADVPAEFRLFDFLEANVPGFARTSDTLAEFTSLVQRVHFTIRIVHTKSEFKTALETPGVHVIYDGHSRFGRGTCFESYTGEAPHAGEMWEKGTGPANGIFRMGYPFVPVALSDMEIRVAGDDSPHNRHRHGPYHFRPVSSDTPAPAREDRHPDARRGLRRILLPADLRGLVDPGFESATHQYWGADIGGEVHILLHANWRNSQATPFDLDATTLACKVFCHFGCSSRLHYREIVRGEDFKAYIRPVPPDDKFAYFTTAPSNAMCTPLWVQSVLTFGTQNNGLRWFESLEDSKVRTNRRLRGLRQSYQVF